MPFAFSGTLHYDRHKKLPVPPTEVGEVGEGVLPLLLHLHLAHIHHECVLAWQGRVDKIAAIMVDLTRKKTPTPSAPIQQQNHHKIVL